MDGGLLLDPVQARAQIRLRVFMERSAPKCATTASWQRRPARRCGTRDRARAHHLPSRSRAGRDGRARSLSGSDTTKVGETDSDIDLRSGHRVERAVPAARIRTSAAEARAIIHERWCVPRREGGLVRLPHLSVLPAYDASWSSVSPVASTRPRPASPFSFRTAVPRRHGRDRACLRGSSTPDLPATQPW